MAGNKKPSRQTNKGPRTHIKSIPAFFLQVPEKEENYTQFVPYLQLEKFRNNTACFATWDQLLLRINVGLYLALKYFDRSVEGELAPSVQSLKAIETRRTYVKKYVANDEEITEICNGLIIVDGIQTLTTHGEQLEAFKFVYKTMQDLLTNGIK